MLTGVKVLNVRSRYFLSLTSEVSDLAHAYSEHIKVYLLKRDYLVGCNRQAVCISLWLSVTDSDHMVYGNSNGMNSESTVTPGGRESKTEIRDYSYTEGNTDDPGMSSADMNPTYPEVVLNPGADSASSDSILGHM